MSRSGNTYSLPSSYNPVVTGTTVSSTAFNATMTDIATAITQSWARDGSGTPSGNMPMATFKFTGMGDGSALTDSATLGQVQTQAAMYVGSIAGTATAITGTTTPAFATYATGMAFWFLPGSASTGATTIAINGLSAIAIKKQVNGAATALATGDMKANYPARIFYDGTQFWLTNPLGIIAGLSVLGVTGSSTTSPAAITGTADQVLRVNTAGNALAFGTIATAGVADAAITYAKIADGTGLSVVGRSANSAGVNADIVGTDGQVLRVSGTSLGFGSIATAGITDNAVTLAKLATQSNNTILSNASGGAAVPSANSLSTVLDMVGSAAQGDILYRGAATWTRLGAGTNGQVLTTGGAGANPSWGTSASSTLGTPVASTSGTTITFTGIPSTAREIIISLVGVSTNGTDNLMVVLGTSGGIESSGYSGAVTNQAGTVSLDSVAFLLTTGGMAAAGNYSGQVRLVLENSSANTWSCGGTLNRNDVGASFYFSGTKSVAAALDRVQVTTSGAVNTFDAGEINILYRS